MPSGQFSNRQKPAAEKLLISISNLAEQAMKVVVEQAAGVSEDAPVQFNHGENMP
jgi:hypothetical protein